jgi:hypothetical protein
MGGDIILQDCGKHFVLPVFLRVSGNTARTAGSSQSSPNAVLTGFAFYPLAPIIDDF